MSFGTSAEKKKKQVIGYQTYRQGNDEFRIISREKEKASDTILDISARTDEFRIICREKEKADDKISDVSGRSDEFWTTSREKK